MASLVTVFLFQATQTFVAVIGLNYSIHSAVDSSSSIPGGVLYTNLTEFYFKGGEDSISADQLIAHEVRYTETEII